MKDIYLIVGLGNPGPKYAHTRHNAGFDVMERLEGKLNVRLKKKLFFPGELAETADGGKKLILCRPTTFMNRSGECVRRLLNRIGLVSTPSPEAIEAVVNANLPPALWCNFSHLLIQHGRRVCHAGSPECGSCAIAPLCRRRNVKKMK